MESSIAFFDFDGTITTRDSFLEFIRFTRGSTRFWAGFALCSPWIIAMKAGLISNSAAKQRVLVHFFKKTPLADFQQSCEDFAANKIPAIVRPKALAEIRQFLQKNIEVVVVTASPKLWVEPWCQKNGLTCLGTELELQEGKLSGKILGNNCHGTEKVSRIKEKYSLSQYQSIYAYGDSGGDKPMLSLATHAFYQPFR